MSNVLTDDKQQQILALGRLGWTLRRIEQATGVRRETVSGYLGRNRRARPRSTRRGPSKTGHFRGGVHRLSAGAVAAAADARPAGERL